MLKKSSFILFALFFILGCNSQPATFKNLDPQQFEKSIVGPGVQLVDVRTPEEFKEKHIAGAANYNINASDFQASMSKLDKEKPLYIYCLSGGRSKRASDWAMSNGFKQVYNLEFGINSWIDANKTVVSGSGDVVKGLSGLTFDQYLSRIKSSTKLVLVDFNAIWCGPCKMLKPIVTKVVKKNSAKVELFDVDVDTNNMVSSAMNVKSIPLLILYKDGKEVWRNLGLTDEETISAKIAEFSK
ncbi:MAG: thioredoxin [Bacteroidetes bacterium]|nr:thioredoxin [Bacteroidota bacterium]MBK8657734.1 thioredoxin [Bacteroidota bacterium]